MWVSWITGFFAGFLCLALLEVCTVILVLKRLLRDRPNSSSSCSADNAAVTFQPPHIFLQGDMWVAALPASASKKEVIKILVQKERAVKDHRRRKESDEECVEILPTKRHARLDNNVLRLMSEDGSEERIDMRGCKIVSVSGGKEIARKWAKKYPIKLESFDQQLQVNSSICLLYLETSWEKETWCQVLRAAAKWTINEENWYMARKREFHDYCLQLDEAYPAFAKHSGSKTITLEDEKLGKLDKSDVTAGLSRRQRIWKKLKGSSKETFMYKEMRGTGDASVSSIACMHEESDLQPCQESQISTGNEIMGSSSFKSNAEKVYADENDSFSDSAKNLEHVVAEDMAMSVFDQGTMCLNILCSRLFFDGYHSARFQEACHKLIQKQLSKIVMPGYMGRINCTKLELGSKPPFIHSMQVLPKDSDFIWSFDAVVEYSGGAQIKIDTRLDVSDSVSQENVVNQSLEPTLAGAAAADILRKGLETIEKSMDVDVMGTDSGGERGNDKATNNTAVQPSKGRWKSVLARVADQVSMVPITLSMRLVLLKGSIRIQIKPPPTDRIWFGFTSMPTIELQPEPSIGDHRITTGPVIAFITNRIKILIQETLVLPNCEGIWVPWMIAEKDDWIRQEDMPVPWSHLDARASLPREEGQAMKDTPNSVVTEVIPAGKKVIIRKHLSTSFSDESDSAHEMERPHFDNASEFEAGGSAATADANLIQDTVRIRNFKNHEWMDSDHRSSRRAKMMHLGKKVTEKLDEKRRLVVEKMREGLEKYEQGAK